jgi:hypothetical protein
VARSASLEGSRYLPTYGWWPRSEQFTASVVVTPYHYSTDAEEPEFVAVLRGYLGSAEPVWEHDLGRLRKGDDRIVALTDLDVLEPPDRHGGIVELHTVRTDKQPRRAVAAVGMWIDAVGADGGGYVIPTQPIRGAVKVVARDDVQVAPGIMATGEVETEVLLLNPIGDSVTVRLVASSTEGLKAESKEFEIGPYSAWYGPVREKIPNLGRLLAPSDGLGSLAIYSDHRLLPHFGFRKDGGPVGSMDHTAPIFGA